MFDRFDGCSAQALVAAARELRTSRKADRHFTEGIVFAAIRSIEQCNAQAMARADISITDWPEDCIIFEEELLMNGFQIQPNHAPLERARDGMGGVVKAADLGRAEAAWADSETPLHAGEEASLIPGPIQYSRKRHGLVDSVTIPVGNENFRTAQTVSNLRARHVKTPRHAAFTEHLDRLLIRADSGALTSEPARFTSTHETRGIAVIDGPGGGKTSLIDHVLQNHPALQADSPDGNPRFLAVTVPSPATLKSLDLEILRASGYPDISERRERWSIWDLVRRRLAVMRVSVLWIDEAHDLFGSSTTEANHILKTLKSLMQGPEAVIVVLSGVEQLWAPLRRDAQIQRRFTKLALPGDAAQTDGQQIAKLMSSYCQKAELAAPQSPDLVPRLIHASRQRFGRCIEGIINAIDARPLGTARPSSISRTLRKPTAGPRTVIRAAISIWQTTGR